MKPTAQPPGRCGAAGAWMVVALFALLLGADTQAAEPIAAQGRSTVVWISMDGFRYDYLDRTKLPFFAQMCRDGAFSRKFRPVFPPITFPSHSSEATGVSVSGHGISGNSFHDSAAAQSFHFPTDSLLLLAEPIWLTAQRQGVRALVYDWPLSQAEHAPLHAAYSAETFDNAVSDDQRLDHLLATWHDDTAQQAAAPDGGNPLRLLMGYVEGTDPPGHKFGPDAPEIAEALQKLDATVGAFFTRAVAQWKEHAGPHDRLYVLLTTDHGMSPVTKFANLEKMLALGPKAAGLQIETTANVGSIYLDHLPAGVSPPKMADDLVARLSRYPFARVYRRADLPADWGYGHPTRVGDVVVVLPRGYTFDRMIHSPVEDRPPDGTPKGMHGYPTEDDPEMFGVTMIWRAPQAIGGIDLGEVRWDQYEPTVAKWLGIAPAPAAHGRAIVLPGD